MRRCCIFPAALLSGIKSYWDRFLGAGKNDYFNARLIINGYTDGIPDKADEFKDYAELFEGIINETI